ncbi:hypothetical protein DERP_012957 [Dermatophagoides pteronyssinus]|uniref:Uncharacterized protein n=1 Tax=Dermatophagoides pteronyssinus TaxID=6956 RepID=A0ABQ8ISS3_DERPT|nr:hypothetical protein DERP_012957 [Dermatophagoides pteronyssinus]
MDRTCKPDLELHKEPINELKTKKYTNIRIINMFVMDEKKKRSIRFNRFVLLTNHFQTKFQTQILFFLVNIFSLLSPLNV